MDFNSIPLFSTMKVKLNYMSARQAVLAQNIANADTPDYKAKDISAPDFKQMMGQSGIGSAQNLPLSATSKKHISGGSGSGTDFQAEKRKSTYELNPTGNNVVIEEEMMKVAENQAEYQKVLNLYRKTIDLFKTAIGRPSGGA